MQTIYNYANAAVSYSVAVLALFYNSAIENYSTIVAVLGFILLVARLVQEVPKALHTVIGWFKKDKLDGGTS